MCSCFDVADYFLTLLDDNAGDVITNLKMQKLVYYAQGYSLAIAGKPLFDEEFEAWMHGPVVPELYHKYKEYGNFPLPIPRNVNFEKFTEDEKELLNEVYRLYGQFSAWRLRDMTHEEPPWKDAPANGIITKKSMKAYFDTQVV